MFSKSKNNTNTAVSPQQKNNDVDILDKHNVLEDHDDIRILNSYIESDENRNCKFFIYKLNLKDEETGDWIVKYKAIRFYRLKLIPRLQRENRNLIDMQTDILSSIWRDKINFVTLIAHIKMPHFNLLYCYGAQGVADTLEEAKHQALLEASAIYAKYQGTFSQIHLADLTSDEAEWIRRKMQDMKHVSVVRGIPKPRRASGTTVETTLMGGRNVTESEEQLEEILRGMKNTNEFMYLLMLDAVEWEDINHTMTQINNDLSLVKSRVEGSSGFNMGIAIPLGISGNVGDSSGTSTNYGESLGFSEGDSYNYGISDGTSYSYGTSEGYSHGVTHGTSETVGESYSHGNNVGYSENFGTSENIGHSTNYGESYGTNHGTSYGHSFGTSQGNSYGDSTGYSTNSSDSSGTNVGHSTSQSTSTGTSSSVSDNASTGTSSNQGYNQGTNSGWNSGSSENMGTSTSESQSSSTSTTVGGSVKLGPFASGSVSVGGSEGISTGTGTSHGYGTSSGISGGSSEGYSVGSGTSDSISKGTSSGTSTGTSSGTGSSWGSSQSHTSGSGYNVGSSRGTSLGTSDGVSFGESSGESSGVSKGSGYSSGYGISEGTGLSLGASDSYGLSKSIGVSNSVSETSSTSVSESYGTTHGTSEGYGRNTGTSTGYSSGYGTSKGFSSGLGNSFSFSPSVGYSESYKIFNESNAVMAEIITAQRDRFKLAIREGAFLASLYLLTPDEISKAKLKSLSQGAFFGAVFPKPIEVLDVPAEVETHLKVHASSFSPCSLKEYSPDVVDQYIFSTVLLPNEISSFCHLPRVEMPGLDTTVENIPMFRVPNIDSSEIGDIYLGKVVSSEIGRPIDLKFYINKKQLMHTLIAGASGSGKTVAALRMVTEITNNLGMGAIILDWKKDWRVLLHTTLDKSRFKFYSLGNPNVNPIRLNLLAVPKGVDQEVWRDTFTEAFCLAYGLGTRGYTLINQALTGLYEDSKVFENPENSMKITIGSLLERLKDTMNSMGKTAGFDTKDAFQRILDRLSQYQFGRLKEMYGVPENAITINDLVQGNNVVVLEGLGLDSFQKQFIIGLISAGIYLYGANNNGFHHVGGKLVVFEEAHQVVKGKADSANLTLDIPETVYEIMFNEARGYGLYLTAISQQPSHMPDSVIANCSNAIVLRLAREDDVTAMTEAMAKDAKMDNRDVKRWFMKALVGWAVVRLGRQFDDLAGTEPVLVKIDSLDVIPPTDAELSQSSLSNAIDNYLSSKKLVYAT